MDRVFFPGNGELQRRSVTERWLKTCDRVVDLTMNSAFSFNGEPQAEAKAGNEACGLPLNELNAHSAKGTGRYLPAISAQVQASQEAADSVHRAVKQRGAVAG